MIEKILISYYFVVFDKETNIGEIHIDKFAINIYLTVNHHYKVVIT